MPFVNQSIIAQNMIDYFLILLGTVLCILSLLMVLPVLVNFPASWFGALIALLLGAIGVALVYRSVGALRRRKANPK